MRELLASDPQRAMGLLAEMSAAAHRDGRIATATYVTGARDILLALHLDEDTDIVKYMERHTRDHS